MADSNLDHVGIVVPRLESAIEQLVHQLGCEIHDVFEFELPVVLPVEGPRDIPLRVALTNQVPRLEIIEATDGTPWSSASIGLHHLAFYTEDLVGDSERLATTCPIEVRGRGEQGHLSGFTYHTGIADAFRAELIEFRMS